ncbi:unnamed protein product [Parnassius apollo]|uniref:(apollo) hypothetical protein n=1 Tax=Parnassius apollo TaxID=110799 RepID=A0A8S3Y7F2_PARAO|nr:unnamed protein product [Parnassius apollo]
MTKLGGNLNCIHQLCLAHGLQLAIVDTFYVKNQENVNEAQEELAENENNLNTVCIGTEDDTETGGFQIEQAPTVTVDVETNIKFGLVVEKGEEYCADVQKVSNEIRYSSKLHKNGAW